MIDRIFPRLNAGKPVLIAEIGVNYYDIARVRGMSLLDAAKLMVVEAARAGIHAVKFQTYRATTLAARESPSYWDLNENPVTSQRELFSHFDKFGPVEYAALAHFSEENGVEFFSTAFDEQAADYLEPLMNVYKISSSDLSNLPFVEYQARKGKPVILSIGASNEDEIDRAVGCIRSVNACPLSLLHCVLEYPTPMQDVNLLKIASLKRKYPDCIIGYSDHSKPTPDAIVTNAARLLGAQIVEKHFTLDKMLPGNDHFHAMDPADAQSILAGFELCDMILGNGELKCLATESAARKNARRSLVSTVDIPAGTTLSAEMLTAKRPGHGLSPMEIDKVVGCRAACLIPADTVILPEMVATHHA